MDSFHVVRVFESKYMTVPQEVKRTWRERLFTRPFRPFRKTKIIQVPNPNLYRTPFGVYGHPETIRKLKAALAEKNAQVKH